MRCIEYNFTYNNIEFLNTLTIRDVFTEDNFNNGVNLIVKQVQLPFSAINNISENNFMLVSTEGIKIKTYFDKHTINDAARFVIAKLIKELKLELSDELDLDKYLNYKDNDVESSRDYPIIHIVPSEHEEFTFSTYPFHYTNDYLDSVIKGLLNHLNNTGVTVEELNGSTVLKNPKESILIGSSIYGKRITIGFINRNEIEMSLRSKVALILDSCIFGINNYKMSQAISFMVGR